MTARAEVVACPVCGSDCWDNRLTKRNPKAPDWKCKDPGCEGCIWPPKKSDRSPAAPAPRALRAEAEPAPYAEPPDQFVQRTTKAVEDALPRFPGDIQEEEKYLITLMASCVSAASTFDGQFGEVGLSPEAQATCGGEIFRAILARRSAQARARQAK